MNTPYQANQGRGDTQPTKYVCYYRCSTSRQHQSGLGLEAQQVDVENYLRYHEGDVVGEFIEVESGRKSKRPQLEQALKMCKKRKATLVIAKLDRLSRNVAFVSNLMESGVNFVAVDNPHASKLTIQILSCVAEFEADLNSRRTKAALARSTKRLGVYSEVLAKKYKKEAKEFAHTVIDTIREIQDSGITTLGGIAARLNELKVATPKGGSWYPSSVKRVLERV